MSSSEWPDCRKTEVKGRKHREVVGGGGVAEKGAAYTGLGILV